tara:strand:- start:2566 stop:3066 length:501 start_codon:yes stop_codon:yes gene_type:complete
MFQKICLTFFLLFIVSCNNLDYVYNENKSYNNPIYNESEINLGGLEIPSFYSQVVRHIGLNEEGQYQLIISIDEEKIKRSVEKNQAISKLDYVLRFKYELLNKSKKCFVFEKNIISRFTFEPKASGYNFGSDHSLNDFYRTAGNNNLQEFIGFVSNIDLTTCIDEA